MAPAVWRTRVARAERQQPHHAEVQAGADDRRPRARCRQAGVRRRSAEEGLAEKERAEGNGLRDHEHDRTEYQHLGEEHEWPTGRGGERGADRARRVLAAHNQNAEDTEYELAEEDPGAD